MILGLTWLFYPPFTDIPFFSFSCPSLQRYSNTPMRPNFPVPVVLTVSDAVRRFAPFITLACTRAGVNSWCSTRARVFYCVYVPHARHRIFDRAFKAQHRFPHYFPHVKPVASASMSPSFTTVIFYDRVCSRVSMSKFGRIRSKIDDRSIGEGGSSLPCPFGLVIDGAQTGRVDSSAYSSRCGFSE